MLVILQLFSTCISNIYIHLAVILASEMDEGAGDNEGVKKKVGTLTLTLTNM
jgi:hypothetical protein